MTKTTDRIRLIVICLALSVSVNYQYAFSCTYTNSAVHSLQRFLSESNNTVADVGVEGGSRYSWLWNVVINLWFIGFLPGVWSSSFLIEKFGRKAAFLVGNILNAIGSVLRCASILLEEPGILMGARALCGFATAIAYCSLVLYLQEVSPSSIRGMTSCLNGLVYSLVALMGITLGNDSLLGDNLLYYFVSAVPPCVFGVVIVAILPETPKYLVAKGDYEKASLSVRFYFGKSAHLGDSLKSIERDVGEASTSEVRLVDLFAIPHLRAALKLFLASLQNTVALWTILFSSTFFLEHAGVEHSLAQWSSSVMAGAYLAGTIAGAILIERCGRRKLMLCCNTVNIASLIFYVFFAETARLFYPMRYGCLAMFTLFGFTFGAGVGPVARFIGIELVPLRYRSIITTVGFTWDTVTSCATAFLCGPLFHLIGPFAFLLLFVAPSSLCTAYLYLYLPETKDRDSEEIVNILK